MKFSSAVDVMQKENRFLRVLVLFLLFIIASLTLIDALLFDRTPVVVERSTRGMEIVRASPLLRSKEDLELAVNLMMKARFDSNAKSPELFVNPKELLFRTTEQSEMKARGMTQAIVVRDIHMSQDQAVVDLDRDISVGDLRSALRTKIRLRFEETTPNELNPYGLLLSTAEPVLDSPDPKDARSK